MFLVQNIRQQNQSKTGISFGFDEMRKLKAPKSGLQNKLKNHEI